MDNESGFRNPKISDVKKNIKLILSELEPLPTRDVKGKLELAMKSSSKNKIMDYLESAEEDLFDIINRITADWVLKNRDVPIY
jgi:nitrate reductase NapAB chaperone NapD